MKEKLTLSFEVIQTGEEKIPNVSGVGNTVPFAILRNYLSEETIKLRTNKLRVGQKLDFRHFNSDNRDE